MDYRDRIKALVELLEKTLAEDNKAHKSSIRYKAMRNWGLGPKTTDKLISEGVRAGRFTEDDEWIYATRPYGN